jgi:outer membrane protein TolC
VRLLVTTICVTCAVLAAAPAAFAQARPLSLDEALDLAESRSEQVAIARTGVERAGGQLSRARADLFPQLSASASYDRALASEFSGIFDDVSSGQPCDAFVADPSASVEMRLAELERAVDCGATGATIDSSGFTDLPFGRKNTYRVNVSFSQNLFSGGRIGAQVAQANAARTAADVTLAAARAQLALDVVQAYYDAALSARLLEIAEATYTQADATLAQTRMGFDAGTQPEFELLRAQVARDNLRPAVIRSQSQRDIALLRLKQLLEIPPAEAISLTTPLEGDGPPAPAHLPVAIDAPIPESVPDDLIRAPVREAEASVRQLDATVDAARAQRFPTISLTSSYGEVAYPSDVPTFGDFRRNWTVGAIVQLPILTGGRLRADEVIARADRDAARYRLQQTREITILDSLTTYEELRAARASWEASAGTVQQAERAYQIAELRYKEGVSTQLELSDAQVLLVQAQATRAQATRDLQVARARVALLPDLPVGAAGQSGAAPQRSAPSTSAQPQPFSTTATPTGAARGATAGTTGTGGGGRQ